MTTDLELRPYTDDDADAVRALNEANVPEVGTLDAERLAFFATEAWFQVATAGDRLVGLFVGLPHGTRYWSPNHLWFAERFPSFGYVDRVAIDPGARRLGIGRSFYRAFEHWARDHRLEVLCAEVNHEPPNPVSMSFHRAMGFTPEGLFQPYGDGYVVQMLSKRLTR